MTMENKSKALEYLRVPRSTFYYASLLGPKDEELRQKIEAVLDKHPSYGHKRIALSLHVSKKPVLRVMKKYGIKPRRGRKRPWKRAVGEERAPSPNLLVSFNPLYKNHVWVTDFTYLWWRGRWVYVCTIIDLWSRQVLGISIKTNHSALLVSEALLNALSVNPAAFILHSDQGSEYKSKLFRSILEDFKVTQSMSKKASPWQNGYQESFYGNWKVDIGDVNRLSSLGELTAEIYKSIYYYNNERIHTALLMTPKEFARQS